MKFYTGWTDRQKRYSKYCAICAIILLIFIFLAILAMKLEFINLESLLIIETIGAFSILGIMIVLIFIGKVPLGPC